MQSVLATLAVGQEIHARYVAPFLFSHGDGSTQRLTCPPPGRRSTNPHRHPTLCNKCRVWRVHVFDGAALGQRQEAAVYQNHVPPLLPRAAPRPTGLQGMGNVALARHVFSRFVR